MRTLIRGVAAATVDPELGDLARTDILIEDGVIREIRPDIAVDDASFDGEIVDGTDKIAIPGMVDTHRHTWQTALRGILADGNIPDYLRGIRLHGEDVFRRTGQARVDVPARRRRIGYVFQDYALFPFLSVRQNVAFGLQGGWLNPSPDRRDERVERWLHALRIDDVADSLPGEISGGQRQRTALARALAPGPQALLLDEPFAALDHALRDHLRSELQHVLAQAGIPLLLISHDPQDVAMFGGQVFRIDGGRVVGPDEAGSSSPLTPPCP